MGCKGVGAGTRGAKAVGMRLNVASQHSQGAVIGVGVAATAAALVACLTTPAPPVAILIPASPMMPAAPVPVPPPVAAPKAAPKVPNPRAGELMLVLRAGHETYIRLADVRRPGDEDSTATLAVPRHGRLRLAEDDGVQSAIAAVAARDLPGDYGAWRGRTVKVGPACEAKVISFAVIARLTGDPSYAGKDLEAWDAASVMASGAPVLAAKLDGCDGLYARDAALPAVVVPEVLHDAALEQAGRAALIASEAAAETQRAWDQQLRDIGGTPHAWTAEPEAVTAEVLRHPITGETFVAVHGHVPAGCGDPHANVWGLFRVVDRPARPSGGADGRGSPPVGGALVTVELRDLGELESIDAVLDVDGDGRFELLGKPWLGNAEVLTSAAGDALDRLDLPFYGCPC